MADLRVESMFALVHDSERHTFLQYLREASPWVAEQDQPLVAQLTEMANLETALLEKLAQEMHRQRIPVTQLGTYPARFTHYNFTNLRKLVSVVIRDHETRIGKLLDLLPGTDYESRVLVEQMIELKRKHLASLKDVAAN